MAEKEVVFTPKENFVWDTSVVMYDAKQLLEREQPPEHYELLRIVEKAAALNQYHDLMVKL